MWAAPFSGVNESTWEHMKLLFWPMLLFAIAQRFFFRDRKNFWAVKLRGTLLGLFLIPALFYTCNGAIGKSPDWINIAIFFLSAALVYCYEARLFRKDASLFPSSAPAVVALTLIALLFVLFTFRAPHLPLFRDPLTGAYEISG